MSVAAETIVVVRALPAPGHKYRWCGLERWVDDPKTRPDLEMEELPQGGFKPVYKDGKPVYKKNALPWPADEVKVILTDDPPPYDPNMNDGRPTHISPRTLTELMRDERISTRVTNGKGGDPVEVSEMKTQLAEMQERLTAAERLNASLQETRDAAIEEAQAKAAGEAAKMRQEIAELRGRLAEKKGKGA